MRLPLVFYCEIQFDPTCCVIPRLRKQHATRLMTRLLHMQSSQGLSLLKSRRVRRVRRSRSSVKIKPTVGLGHYLSPNSSRSALADNNKVFLWLIGHASSVGLSTF